MITLTEQNNAISDDIFHKALAALERTEQELISVRNSETTYPAGAVLSEWRAARKTIALSGHFKGGQQEMTTFLADARPVVVEEARHTAAVALEEWKTKAGFDKYPDIRLQYRGAQVAAEAWLKDWTERIDIRERLYEYRVTLAKTGFALPEEVMAARIDRAIAEGHRAQPIDLSLRYLTQNQQDASVRHNRAVTNLETILRDARKAGFTLDNGVAKITTPKQVEKELYAYAERA
jgi:hypothetical protein